MAARVWDRYLSEQDRAHVTRHPAVRKGVGSRPILLLIDLYRWVFGDQPESLLDATEKWPGSCGLAGWECLPAIERLLAVARDNAIPVIHVTGLEGIPGWRHAEPRTPTSLDDEAADRLDRRYEIIKEVAPINGEFVLRKAAPSAFWGTPLVGLLRELDADTIVVAGESTSGCVRATVVDAKSHRFKVLVVEEAVFDRHEACHAINLFDMDQKYADVVGLDEAIGYLNRTAAARTESGNL